MDPGNGKWGRLEGGSRTAEQRKAYGVVVMHCVEAMVTVLVQRGCVYKRSEV